MEPTRIELALAAIAGVCLLTMAGIILAPCIAFIFHA